MCNRNHRRLNCHLFSVDQPEMTVPLVNQMNPTCRMKTIPVDVILNGQVMHGMETLH